MYEAFYELAEELRGEETAAAADTQGGQETNAEADTIPDTPTCEDTVEPATPPLHVKRSDLATLERVTAFRLIYGLGLASKT